MLYSSELSDVKLTDFFLSQHFNGLKFWGVLFRGGVVGNGRDCWISHLFFVCNEFSIYF